MNKKVIVIGAGGHAKVIADIIRSSGDTVEGFLDDSYTEDKAFYGAFVVGKICEYERYAPECCFVIAIGSDAVREKIAKELNCQWYTAIHPSAVVSESAKIGEGTVVMANAVINADATVGKHCIINTATVVEHDCTVGDYSHLSPRSVVCGATSIGSHVWLGTGSTVVNVVSICDGATIGAGGVVVRSINEAGTYVGVPAKKIK